ncbi:MAG: tRNA preQ1(34) S-adenosylmethionine ribosyltransferase-isomerase QueA [Chloroflexi bacterium HGW-Chloroflexi-6]|nr:MAG: tRNA preQ1(34) S-adenosylmethionine ribosyltransferase-isomerase QueA [Chloroflexi bacterium HGW-Chloroflexi-6]
MKTSDFNYELPDSFIAQTPVEPRDSSRLMVLNRKTGQLEHRIFREIVDYLNPGDLLVVNQTRVIPARLPARKETGGKAEILLLRRESDRVWECLVGGKGLGAGKRLSLADGLEAEVVEVLEGSRRRVRFDEPVENHLSLDGQMPLPPYIHEKLTDPERYQTVYAKTPGSAAAPTAGLHFTPRLMDELRAKGIQFAEVTLHVGLDTFAPVTEDNPTEHKIHTEWCELSPETAAKINATKLAGGRVIGVGTTSVRTLESAMVGRDTISSYAGPTSIFILPGYQYKVVDAIITNFHLPKSTLIMMISAFAGRETVLNAYETAKREGYRFFSFGDAMFIS